MNLATSSPREHSARHVFRLGLFDGRGIHLSSRDAVRDAQTEEEDAEADDAEEARRQGGHAHDGVPKDVCQSLSEVQVRLQRMGGEQHAEEPGTWDLQTTNSRGRTSRRILRILLTVQILCLLDGAAAVPRRSSGSGIP